MKLFLPLLLLFPAYTLQAQQQGLKVTELAPNVYVHTSFQEYSGVAVPSHGLLVSTAEGAVLIDTGWGNEPTAQLLAWIKANLKQSVKVCIPTHFHDDKMGGISVVQAQGIPIVSSQRTAILAAAHQKGTPDITFASDTAFTIGGQRFEVHYPGGGHTADNVIVYLPQQKILFGGCFVKDEQAKTLGNIADADLQSWPVAIRRVQQRYPKAKVVVPSHGPWGGRSLLRHTLSLLQKQGKAN